MSRYSFDLIRYSRPWKSTNDKHIDYVIGLDTESDSDGKPFMFTFSDNFCCGPEDIPGIFFTDRYKDKDFGVWNLSYDSGSLLYNMPPGKRTELRESGKTNYKGYNYYYIPHKLLRISYKGSQVHVWDIMPFYSMSLDAASIKYLKKQKISMPTKTFTREYIDKHYWTIVDYSIHDAVLVAELYDSFVKRINSFGIYPRSLYSLASISLEYFKKNVKVVDVWYYWKYHRELLRYAFESYSGGKFEVYARGKFTGYEYDINSAFASAIADLYDITYCRLSTSANYEPEATYGFIRCRIDNTKGDYIPVSYNNKYMCLYPCGIFNATITKEEYEYLIEYNIPVKIYSAFWLYPTTIRKPYKKIINNLHKLKYSFKETDLLNYHIVKGIMNTFYGKMVQAVEKPNGTYRAGSGWNIIYASIVTAHIRVMVTRLTKQYNTKVLAVHTDSIITTEKLPDSYVGTDLGKWSLVKSGPGVLIGSGIYTLADKNRFRGFYMKETFNWLKVLKDMKGKSKINVPQTVVKSWVQANFEGKDQDTNKFTEAIKEFNLNCDRKRGWGGKSTGNSLLKGLQWSFPVYVFDKES